MGADVETSGTAADDEALERRNWNRLAAAVAVAALCLLGIVVVHRVRRFLHSIARSQIDEP